MDLSTILITGNYEEGYIELVEMTWNGDSVFTEFSQELLKDNVFNEMEDFHLGDDFQFGPYQLKLVSINNSRDVVLFKLINQEKLQGTYVGSIENEWNWQLKEKE